MTWKPRLPIVAALVVGSICLLPAVIAVAQVPPHAPGTVCYTPVGYCAAQPPGPPGTPCACPSPTGPVGGVRG